MKLNSPLPQTLDKECAKAAKIFKSFVDSGNNGLDGVIPRSILENAKGFAIFTIFKAGFVFSARAGSGIVIAKLDNGTWSAPSAIGTAGLGLGGQAGAEMTDFLVVLNSHSVSRSFMAAGSLNLGGNMSLALGPLGRNGEASGALSSNGKVAAMYSYSKTRGLFGGVSVEGSVIVERQDANFQAYNSPVTARMLLGGTVDPPPWALPLIKTLEACTGMPGGRDWINDESSGVPGGSYAFGGLASPGSRTPSFLQKKRKPEISTFPPQSWGSETDSGSYFNSAAPQSHSRNMTWDGGDYSSTSNFKQHLTSTKPFLTPRKELLEPPLPHEGVARAIALYDFNAVEVGDLSFKNGEIIIITQKSNSNDDWWTGKVHGRQGIFPANFVEVV
ncbi:hypothetical protein B0H34DRAFT_646722 [Crassisporium funariophilum]|nr:hypothetical protein B0H34DRAFT_646722 [Crassisporium funariophilum]